MLTPPLGDRNAAMTLIEWTAIFLTNPANPTVIEIAVASVRTGISELFYSKAQTRWRASAKRSQYRLIVDLVYASQRIYIKYVLTHAEYDKGEWKSDSYF